jgi:hypothetical protein
MIALVRFNPLSEDGKSRIEYGNQRDLMPLKRAVFDERGKKNMVYVDYIFEPNKDYAVTRENIIKELSEVWMNPRIKTESDWQSKKVEEWVLVDGILKQQPYWVKQGK